MAAMLSNWAKAQALAKKQETGDNAELKALTKKLYMQLCRQGAVKPKLTKSGKRPSRAAIVKSAMRTKRKSAPKESDKISADDVISFREKRRLYMQAKRKAEKANKTGTSSGKSMKTKRASKQKTPGAASPASGKKSPQEILEKKRLYMREKRKAALAMKESPVGNKSARSETEKKPASVAA
eukprot:TRINITY_DN5670_c1_g1_i1.p1 TRINITY_DN5670_c1_g1~~TRINITY_DN5670_c1_g1_i1.p1  ORF type:complete len:191 (-),score=41.33 TRINITY_DN5670_c1_g1_i1:285-830(-)